MQILCKYMALAGIHRCEKEQPDSQKEFANHVSKFGLSYATSDEYNFRHNEWQKKDKYIDEVNQSQDSYELGHNMFSTWTDDEFKTNLRATSPLNDSNIKTFGDDPLPASIDWRAQGVVNPVKNMGECYKADYVFGAVSSIESHFRMRFGTLYSLSEQQVIDCAVLHPVGCNVLGHVDEALKYAMNGLMTTADYPYMMKQGKCQFDATKIKVKTTNIHAVKPQSSHELKAAVAAGPVATVLDMSSTDFQMYKSGIFDSDKCGTVAVNGATIVGYGLEDKNEFYIVRNQWSDTWGEAGYIRIATKEQGKGICGIQQLNWWPETAEPSVE